MPQSLVVWKACWFKRSHGVAFCRTYFTRKSSDTTGKRQIPDLSRGTRENETSTSFQDVVIPPDGDLQLLRNIVKRGDKMGTRSFRIA